MGANDKNNQSSANYRNNEDYSQEFRSYRTGTQQNKTMILIVTASVAVIILLAVIMVLALSIANNNTKSDSSNSEKEENVVAVNTDTAEEENKEGEEEPVVEESTAEGTLTEEPEETSGERVTMYVANVENSVYFRSEPKENDSNIITTIPFGTAVVFLSNEDSVFAKVEHKGQQGYIKRDYLSASVPKRTEKPEKTTDNTVKSYKYVNYVENSVYLRKSPDDNSGYYTTIPVGEQVGFIEETNSKYAKVSYRGMIGYVTSKYLSDTYSTDVPDYMTVCNVPNSIYLRNTPSETSDNIICTIPVGSLVEYIDYGNGTFYKIAWNGNVGYAKSKYLTW